MKSEFIKRFNNFGELSKYAKRTMDAELTGKIKIVQTYHNKLPEYISKIRAKTIGDERTGWSS